MERGTYRMRAPYAKTPVKSLYPRPSLANKRTTSSSPTSSLAILVILLAFASVSCFGMAYYLFSTRWDTRQLVRRRISDQDIVVDLSQRPLRIKNEPDELFIAYLPHSGFHNQRIAFENALVLARLLNRTLLVPLVHLGNKPIPYAPFNILYQELTLCNKDGLNHCSRIASQTPVPLECIDYINHTHIPWSWLVDLDHLHGEHRLLQTWNMTEAWVQEYLNISKTDILYLKDNNPYHYRFLDSRTDISPSTHKFLESIYIPDLQLSTKRLLHIGTLFGSSRLRLKNYSNIAIRGHVRDVMGFSNPSLLNAAKMITDSLGPFYLGVHLRLRDGDFKKNAVTNVRNIWWHLMHQSLNYTWEETIFLERSFLGQSPEKPEIVIQCQSQSMNTEAWPYSPPNIKCRGRLHSDPQLIRLNMPIFISTDVRANNPLLVRFQRTFPCLFYLSDFPTITAQLDDWYNPMDGIKMAPFMLPFLDALVVGHSWKAVGTENSTFSRFIQDVVWRKFHGLDIIQRG
ncbi:hypothetical protein H0H81_010030 [Sphagnurus paluster]|uniref:O-fucosyltransferase family protein n=1 Tax=Sphagnurus paluster TaxID=117069 RepID=A0A9P7K5A6_9AGAR|nr:hypothetical protein H0H81_010030 [Sphagnurus paluster]